MELDEFEFLAHYGTPRHSGRYPWGSGGKPIRSKDFLSLVQEYEKKGLREPEIAKALGIKTTQLRARISIANNQEKQAKIAIATRLKAKGMSNVAIGKQMGLNESSVRSLLKAAEDDRANVLNSVADALKSRVAEDKYIDIGSGTESQLGISATRLKTAVALLKEEGYRVSYLKTRQLGTGLDTTRIVLSGPESTYSEVSKNRDQIQQYKGYSNDGGRTHFGIYPPLKIDQDRIAIRYGDEGGAKKDGVIEVRPGVPDISLGTANYAQVRISVGDGHYLKGMAMYKDDLPEGVDLIFNTNKDKTENKLDAMKPVEKHPDGTPDLDNPYGASIKRQIAVKNPDGSVTVTSAMNIVHEEGNWADWSKTISSQMLSKQSPTLARSQLKMTYEARLKEFEEISALTNPTVRKYLLMKFGDGTDSAAVQLDAAGIKRQGWHVILPIDSIKPTEIYAPNFASGEQVALIRFPHAGTFEIPKLVVNNNHPESKRLLGKARDAVGIHHSVAERLSGADFDGDTVLVIPNDSGKIKDTPALERLKDFNPRVEYRKYDGMPVMTSRQKGIEMGKVSNLITDMTIRKASTEHLARAVRHSMVVIDAEKHELDYKRSYVEHGIAELSERYQGKKTGGASTLISKATAELRVNDRKARPAAEGGPIDRETGKRVYVETGKINFGTGKPATTKSTKLAETDDAFSLVSGNGGTPIERVYAEHSNRLKALANQARKDAVNTPPAKYDGSAKKVYAPEVASLNAKLASVIANRPLERQAQTIANGILQFKKDSNPHMDPATIKKISSQALTEARHRVGLEKVSIIITPKEWEAIQAGAISDNHLQQILAKADIDVVRQLATPRSARSLSSSMATRARTMLDSGYTRAEVANQLGVSITTMEKALAPSTEEE